jgi:hypothetical protein
LARHAEAFGNLSGSHQLTHVVRLVMPLLAT